MSLRQNIRNYLWSATWEEAQEELRISQERGDVQREELIRETMLEWWPEKSPPDGR